MPVVLPFMPRPSALSRAASERRAQARAGQLVDLGTARAADTRVRTAVASRRRGGVLRFRPTAPQERMLQSRALRRLFRGPNQVGKTETMCADVVDLMLGLGRWQPERARRHPPPVECWVVCTSWKQSLVIQRKLYAMLPEGVLAKGSKFTSKRGFTGQSFELLNGSLCTIVTIQQDTADLASATLDAVFIDEVPTEEAWGELIARVRQKNGCIATYFTPVNRPVEWFRKKVEDKEIEEFHTALDLAAVWPVGARRPFQTQAQIDLFIKDCPPWQRPQRVEGKWDGASLDRWLADFDPTRHVVLAGPGPSAPTRLVLGDVEFSRRNRYSEWRLCVGFDYGLRPGKMTTFLIAVREGHSTAPEICFLDEAAAGDDTWSMEQLVAQTLAMLKRNGLEYDNVDEWVGDRSAIGRGGKVSNRDMQAHFAAALGRTWSEVKHIATPYKPANSVAYTCGLLNSAFARGFAWVHPRCRRFIDFCNHFAGDERAKTKDIGDAARYAFLQLVKPSAWYRLAA